MLKQTVWLSFLVVLISTIICKNVTFASETNEQPPAPTEGFPAKNPNYGTSSDDADIQSTKYIRSWNSSIKKLGNKKVELSGRTDAYSVVDSIRVKLYLQIWDPNAKRWKDVRFVKGFEGHNTTFISGSATQTVSAKNYYRTRSTHYVKKGSTTENVSRLSGYIYIN